MSAQSDTPESEVVDAYWRGWSDGYSWRRKQALSDLVETFDDEAKPVVPQYVFTFEIQVWADSSYQPQKLGTRKPITVIAATGAEAWAEAERILGDPARGTVRRHALVSATDVRA